MGTSCQHCEEYCAAKSRKLLTSCAHRKKEPTMQEVLGLVRTYANIQRIDLPVRKRNDMHVDEMRGTTKGSPHYKPWYHQGKGPGQWGYPPWNSPDTHNYEPPGYAFNAGHSSSDDWGGKEEGEVAAVGKGKGKGDMFAGKMHGMRNPRTQSSKLPRAWKRIPREVLQL